MAIPEHLVRDRALARVRSVRVRRATREVRVHVDSPFLSSGLDADAFSSFYRDLAEIHELCASTFGASCAWEIAVTPPEKVSAAAAETAMLALAAAYEARSHLSGKWLSQARLMVEEVDERRGFRARIHVPSQPIAEQLVQKGVADWLASEARRAFGLDVAVLIEVDETACEDVL
ncbi:MAG: PolC-type DNA polymerase III, partial [Alicyclobacillus mali]|nr:PolC-type DNA polymerase III [Alicyclobacillus mali (ex Roth et al. 2021)]